MELKEAVTKVTMIKTEKPLEQIGLKGQNNYLYTKFKGL